MFDNFESFYNDDFSIQQRFIDDEYVAESGESEKLYANPKMRDAATSMSTDRLATYPNNHISSLTSLSRGSYSRVSFCLEWRANFFEEAFEIK